MEAYLRDDVLDGIRQARMVTARKKNRLRVHAGAEEYPVVKIWQNGFSVFVTDAQNLRGFVDLYDGARHLFQCLVIHSELDGSLMKFEFKRRTVAVNKVPKDYVVDENAPVGLLGR